MTRRQGETGKEYAVRRRADPEYRARETARRCKRWADPEYRDRVNAQRREGNREWKRRAYAEGTEYARRHKARRIKRRHAKAESACAPIDEQLVWKRDDSICQLCGEPVFMDATYPHPYGPSLDHIIPLSKGGSHTYDNVQLAHLRCNVSKGNRN